MSLRLHLFPRSRFGTGLQFCAPQHRIRYGHCHRLRTPAQTARFVANNAQYSNSGPLGVNRVDNNLEDSAAPDNDVETNTPPLKTDHLGGLVDHVESRDVYQLDNDFELDLDSKFPSELDDRDDKPGPRVSPNLIPSTVIGKLKNLHNIHPTFTSRAVHQVNQDTKDLQTFLRPRSLYVDVAIRATSLYMDEKRQISWKRSINQLVERLRRGDRRQTAIQPFLPYLPDAAYLVRALQANCFRTFEKEWERLSRDKKFELWTYLALWTLQCVPYRLPWFLLATVPRKYKPNCNMVADCFWVFERFYSWRYREMDYGGLPYASIVQKCLSPRDWPIVNTPQSAVRLYTRRTDHEGLCYALKLLKEREFYITPRWLLGIVVRFVEFGDADRALEAFKWLTHIDYPLTRRDARLHCAKILTLDAVEDGPNGRNFRLLPKLLEMGVRPDRPMMNVVLNNAAKTGDPQLGRDVLKFIRGQNFPLDAHTYSIALTNAVACADLEHVEILIREVNRYPEIRDNPYVTSKIMHAHFALTVKRKGNSAESNNVFFDVLDIYTRLYDITPLKELFILPPDYKPTRESANNPPSLMALYIVIATFFRLQRRSTNIERIYAQYRSLVLRGHPVIAPLAETDHTYNEFLVALRSYPHSLRLSVRILEDMMRSHDKIKLRDPKDHYAKYVTHVKPGNRTWTIIMSTFFWNKQPYAAEKIREMMNKHNIKFNQVSWNTIVNGYANAQRIYETAEAIRTMEAQGFQIDDYTVKSLSYLHNQEQLWKVMEEFEQAEGEKETINGESGARTQAREEDEELLVQGLRRLEERKKEKEKQIEN